MNTNTDHPNYAETVDLLKSLKSAGYRVTSVDNGGGKVRTENLEEQLDECLAADQANVYFEDPQKNRLWLWIVLGNNPGEFLSDFADKWSQN